MKVQKYDLCALCRKIKYSDGTIEELLDSKGYNENILSCVMGNLSLLSTLEKEGGCSNCISLLKCAIANG